MTDTARSVDIVIETLNLFKKAFGIHLDAHSCVGHQFCRLFFTINHQSSANCF